MLKFGLSRLTRVACVFLVGIALAGSSAQARKLYPVDEGPKDRSFSVFRRELLRAAHRRDYHFLRRHLDPQIVLNPFGEPITGVPQFEKEWRPKDPKSGLWRELIRILSLGGAFKQAEPLENGTGHRGREFVAPYIPNQWPDSLDPVQYWVIVGRKVPVRRRPEATAPRVAVLSYDIVRVNEKDLTADRRWVKITTPRGRPGYVAADQIRSAGDNEAHFARRHGQWLMTGLYGTYGE
jgi:hypothetical protein